MQSLGVENPKKLLFECKQLIELLDDDIVFGELARETLKLFPKDKKANE